MIFRIKKRLFRDDGTPYANVRVKVSKDGNSTPTRLYTQAEAIWDEQGNTTTDALGLVDIFVGEQGIYSLSLLNAAGTYEFAKKSVSTSESFTEELQLSVDSSGKVLSILGPNGQTVLALSTTSPAGAIVANGTPRILAQTAIPVVLPSSGSSNALGTITHTTALPYVPQGVVKIWLPAGVVTAGSQGTGAKLYSVIYSSTTVCQIQGTGIVTANGAYTQSTGSALALGTAAVPGGAMGANGGLRISTQFAHPNNANNKVERCQFSATTISGITSTTSLAAQQLLFVRNIGQQGAQNAGAIGNSNSATIQATIDTSINQNLTFSGQLAVATDYVILEGYTVEVLPSV